MMLHVIVRVSHAIVRGEGVHMSINLETTCADDSPPQAAAMSRILPSHTLTHNKCGSMTAIAADSETRLRSSDMLSASPPRLLRPTCEEGMVPELGKRAKAEPRSCA